MGRYLLSSIDEAAFAEFCVRPAPGLVAIIVESLIRADVADADWLNSPTEWVREHIVAADWYKGLSEDEMQSWETAIRTALDEPQFAREAHGFHCAVDDMFIEMAQ